MKKKLVLFIIIFIFGFGILYAQESVEQYLLSLKEPNAQDYIKLMYEGSQDSMRLAATKLGEIGSNEDEVIEALIYGLEQGTFYVKRQNNKVVNDFWDVRAASAYALGEIGDPRVLPNLYMSLRYDPDNVVRSSVAAGIGKIGEDESVYQLARAIEVSSPAGPDDIVVLACVEAIGDIGHREGFLPLVEVMRGRFRRSIRLAARELLRKIDW
jgi:HEAT repeat protein